MKVEGDRRKEGKEEGWGTQKAQEALEFLTQEADLGVTTLVDARNGFSELSSLAMLWTVRHRWPAGARFAFNCYTHWAQLLLRQTGAPPVTILSRDGVTQGDPLSMVLYRIILVPLTEELIAKDPGLLLTYYVDDAAFDGLAERSAQLLNLLVKRSPDQGYFPEPDKSLFISDTLGQEKVAKREFAKEGVVFNFVSGSWYTGSYLGLQDQLEAWVKPQVDPWAHGGKGLR